MRRKNDVLYMTFTGKYVLNYQAITTRRYLLWKCNDCEDLVIDCLEHARMHGKTRVEKRP